MIAALERVDAAIVRAEQFLVATLLSVMGLVVFLDVVHRVSTREGSPLGNPLVIAVGGGLVAAAAFHTRGAANPVPKGLAVGVGLAGGQYLLLQLAPNGFIWSQTLALALTLWLGTMGASLATHTRRHLALDIGSKLWPPSIAPKVAAVGHLCTAAFCLVLVYLAGRSLFGFELHGQSVDGHFAGGTLSGTAIPKWAAMLSIPYGMIVIAFRFTLDAYRAWTGRLAVGGDDTLHLLGISEDAS
ncbi:MAG: TRAP transporter small permease subunit [Pseudomonadota bacterium]|nr:TRAP transporter small permease subunit [Pseudomonadota bacterium]